MYVSFLPFLTEDENKPGFEVYHKTNPDTDSVQNTASAVVVYCLHNRLKLPLLLSEHVLSLYGKKIL